MSLAEIPSFDIPDRVKDCVALGVIEEFAYNTNNPRSFEHPVRVASIIGDFVGNLMPSHGFEAVLLHDLPDRFEDDSAGSPRPNARRALQAFNLRAGETLSLQTNALLADLTLVEATGESTRTRVAEESDDPNYISIIEDGASLPILPEYWQIPTPSLNTDEMRELLDVRGVNLETILIKSGEIMDNLENPNVASPVSQLQDIIEAEFYAVLCEITGFDGFSMGIRDSASNARFRNSGRDDLLTLAKKAMIGLESQDEIEKVLSQIFTNGGFLVSRVVDNTSMSHDVLIGDLAMQIGKNDYSGAWRRKSLGAYANKLLKNGGATPMDTLGITIITPDNHSIVDTTKDFITMVEERNEVLKLTPSDKRDKPVVIKGDTGFLDMFRSDDELTRIAHFTENKPGAFRAAKVTMFVTVERPNGTKLQVPVEAQIVSKDDRRNHRIGTASHVAYRNGLVSPTLIRDLDTIYDRRRRMETSPGSLTTASLARAKSFMSRVGTARR